MEPGQRRRAAAAMGMVVAALTGMAAPLAPRTARAGGSVTVTDISPDGSGCDDAANPFSTTSDTTAVASNTRPWADIKGFTVNELAGYGPAGNGLPAGAGTGTALQVSITVCGAVPAFPETTNGDTGVTYLLSFQVPGADPCGPSPLPNGGPPPRQIGAGPHGEPILDGPYPACAGYRFVGYLSVSATGIDFGVGWYDPASGYTLFDGEQTTHTAAGGNADPSNIGTSGTVVHLVIPEFWWWQAPDGTGLWRNEANWFAGETLTNLTALTLWSGTGGSTALGCTGQQPGQPCTNGGTNPFVVDAAPGYQLCPAAAGTGAGDTTVAQSSAPASCPSSNPYSWDYGTTGGPAATVDGSAGSTTVAGTDSYDPCGAGGWSTGIPGQGTGQSRGSLYGTPACSPPPGPGPEPYSFSYSTSWGRTARGGAHYVPSGVSLTF